MRIIWALCVACGLWANAENVDTVAPTSIEQSDVYIFPESNFPIELYAGVDVCMQQLLFKKHNCIDYGGFLGLGGVLCGVRFGRVGVVGLEWGTVRLGVFAKHNCCCSKFDYSFAWMFAIPKINLGVWIGRNHLLESKLCCIRACDAYFCGAELCYEYRDPKYSEVSGLRGSNSIGILYNSNRGIAFCFGLRLTYTFRVH